MELTNLHTYGLNCNIRRVHTNIFQKDLYGIKTKGLKIVLLILERHVFLIARKKIHHMIYTLQQNIFLAVSYAGRCFVLSLLCSCLVFFFA